MRIAVAVALILSVCGAAQADQVDRISILEAGIYSVRVTHSYKGSHDPAAPHTVNRATLLQSTTIVPGRVGIWFGVRYRIDGKPMGSGVSLRLVTRFPEPGIRYPGTSAVHLHSEFIARRRVGQVAYRGFHFDHAAEILPGLWVFEFWLGATKVGEQRFCVVAENPPDPPAVEDPLHDCRGARVS